MTPDIVVEIRNGAVVGIFADLPVSVVLIDWDHAVEPDGITSFIVEDGSGIPQIAAAEPVRPEPFDNMPDETRKVVEFAIGTEAHTRAE